METQKQNASSRNHWTAPQLKPGLRWCYCCCCCCADTQQNEEEKKNERPLPCGWNPSKVRNKHRLIGWACEIWTHDSLYFRILFATWFCYAIPSLRDSIHVAIQPFYPTQFHSRKEMHQAEEDKIKFRAKVHLNAFVSENSSVWMEHSHWHPLWLEIEMDDSINYHFQSILMADS